MPKRRPQTKAQEQKLDEIGEAWVQIRELVIAIWVDVMAAHDGVSPEAYHWEESPWNVDLFTRPLEYSAFFTGSAPSPSKVGYPTWRTISQLHLKHRHKHFKPFMVKSTTWRQMATDGSTTQAAQRRTRPDRVQLQAHRAAATRVWLSDAPRPACPSPIVEIRSSS